MECYSSCVHGICKIINNTYTCDCFPGWTGSYCDQGILTSYSLNESISILKTIYRRKSLFQLFPTLLFLLYPKNVLYRKLVSKLTIKQINILLI